VIAKLTGVYRLIVQLLYGSGLRLVECMRLRVKDLDFGQRQIQVRDAKGGQGAELGHALFSPPCHGLDIRSALARGAGAPRLRRLK
jgi:integrase